MLDYKIDRQLDGDSVTFTLYLRWPDAALPNDWQSVGEVTITITDAGYSFTSDWYGYITNTSATATEALTAVRRHLYEQLDWYQQKWPRINELATLAADFNLGDYRAQ